MNLETMHAAFQKIAPWPTRRLAERLLQKAKTYWELRQDVSDSNLFVTIAFLRVQEFSGKYVPILFGTTAERKQNVSILPDSGSDWWNIDIIEQAGHQARSNHQNARGFGLPRERDNMIRLRALNR